MGEQREPRFPTILAESLHYSPTILSLFGASCRTRTFSLSVLLQWATAPPQEVASIRTEFLRQYRLLGRFSTVRSENFHCLSSALSEKRFSDLVPVLVPVPIVRRAFELARFADSKAIRRVA